MPKDDSKQQRVMPQQGGNETSTTPTLCWICTLSMQSIVHNQTMQVHRLSLLQCCSAAQTNNTAHCKLVVFCYLSFSYCVSYRMVQLQHHATPQGCYEAGSPSPGGATMKHGRTLGIHLAHRVHKWLTYGLKSSHMALRVHR